jgi:peptidoglycan/LPS O-acetylase OafA/YrhL
LATLDRAVLAWLGVADVRIPALGEAFAQLLLVDRLLGYDDAAVGFWSMVTLEQFYFLWLIGIGFAILCVRKWSFAAALGLMDIAMLSVGLVSLLAVCLGETRFASWIPRQRVPLIEYSGYLALGMLLYRCRYLGQRRVLYFALMVSFGATVLYAGRANDWRPLKGIVIAEVLVFFLNGARWPNVLVVRGLRWIGQRSFSVYLVHGVVGSRVIWTCDQYLGTPSDGFAIVWVVVGLMASVAAGALYFICVERPALRVSQSIAYRS